MSCLTFQFQTTRLWVVFFLLIFAGGNLVLPSDLPLVKYLVDVHLFKMEDLRQLNQEGFDVAGVNRKAMTAGVVATAEDLEHLFALGFTYDIRERTEIPGPATKALSDYTDPQEMSVIMDQIVANHPTLAKKLILTDTLFEGQVVYALKITKDVDQDNLRPSFVLDAQHHAREVMTPEIARDMMEFLTSQYATNPNVQRWVDNINIYIIPVVNPDGAMYVFQHDTMWRKNRNPVCKVDLNRNYPTMWASCNGSSGSCSSDTYRGPTPASEPETQGVLDLHAQVRATFALSYHSYGEYIMYSYGCNDPDEMVVMDAIAQSLNSILKDDSGATGGYATGPIWSTIYEADGGSVDTQYGQYGTLAYVIEVNSSSFQPNYSSWRNLTVNRQRTAWQYFLNQTLDAPQVQGQVTDASTGLPLTARISLQEVSFTHGESPRYADARGLFHWVTQGNTTYHLTATMPGYCTETREVAVGSGPVAVDIALSFPLAPSRVSAQGLGDNQIEVSWDEVSGISEYRIYRSLVAGGPYFWVGTVPAPGTTFLDSPVSGEFTYYYVVRSFQNCESPASEEASASTSGPCTLAPAFQGVASVVNEATETCSQRILWNPASERCAGPVTYRIYRSLSPGFSPDPSSLIAAGLSGSEYRDHSGLASQTPYYYIVRAVDRSNGVEDSNRIEKRGVPTGPSVLGIWTDDAGDTGSATLVLDSPWSVQPAGGNGAPLVYATGTYGNDMCVSATTPAITVQNGSVLSFASKYDLETDYDAGIVEVTTGPSFDIWNKLTTVNYPNNLPNTGNACDFPVSGTNTVFSHSQTPAYSASPYSGSLESFSGQEIRLRWRLGTDGGVTRSGWWIDDIQVTQAMIPGVCVSGVPPTPQEASPATSPLTCQRVGEGESLSVTYAPACGALDHAIFWGTGPLWGGPNWTGAACGLGNSGAAVFDPGRPLQGSMVYFVVVGQDQTREGSYGTSRTPTSEQRPEASGIGPCDKPQDLSGTCP